MTQSTMHHALEFIDKHITNKYSDIMNALYSKTRHTQKEYATCFHMLTNMSLHRYVTERRIHFICEAIMEKPTYPIKHHALDFGYKNDTAMYKDFKDFAKFTPKSVITDGNMFPNNRISFEVITSGNTLQSSHQEETTMKFKKIIAMVLVVMTLVFALTRRYGIRLVEVFVSREKINQLRFINTPKKRDGLIFLLFFIPGTPKDLLTYFVGLTDIRLRTFLLLSMVARVPSVISSTFGGHLLGEEKYWGAVILYGITGLLSLLGMLAYNRYLKKKQA